MIETTRLILRRWRAADREPYAAMMADPEVADWVGGVLSRPEAAARIAANEASIERVGYGRLAIERRRDGRLIGYCGLLPVNPAIPFAPAVEIGWALARAAWGGGYATEAARGVVADGFGRLGLTEILAFTSQANHRSQAVMTRLGFTRDAARDFDHPALAQGHPLRRHIVFALRA